MHRYSNHFPYTIYVYPVLAALAYGLFWVLKITPYFPNHYLTPFLTIAIFGGVVWMFENYFWLLLCRLPISKISDFSGEYEGNITAGGTEEVSVAKLKIRQTWSQIKITFSSGKASSKSSSAGTIFDRRGFDELELIYNYFVQGDTIQSHYGTATIRYREDGIITGEYFTEQDRDSFGRIELKLKKDRNNLGRILRGKRALHHTVPK